MIFLLAATIQALSLGVSVPPGQSFCFEEYFEGDEPFSLRVYHHNVTLKDYVFDFWMVHEKLGKINQTQGVSNHELHMFAPATGLYSYCVGNKLSLPQVIYVDMEHGVELSYQGALPQLSDLELLRNDLNLLDRTVEHVGRSIDSKGLYFEVSHSTLRAVGMKVYGLSAIVILVATVFAYCQFAEIRRVLTERKVI